MTIEELTARIEAAWGADTSADAATWSTDNPAFGQCAVTALVVQDHLGGTLLRGVVGDVSHYWNKLPNGTEVDLTRKQFGNHCELTEVAERERAYVLSFAPTATRYATLLGRINGGAA